MDDTLDLLDLEVPSRVDGQLMEVILNAQSGSIKDLSILARLFGCLPGNPLNAKLHLIFLQHLNSSEVPTEPKSNIAGIVEGLEEGRAFWSLWGLAQLGGPLCEIGLDTDPCGQELIEAWPGIFKWSAFFYTSRVQVFNTDEDTDTTSSQRRSRRGIIRDVIVGSWCSLALSKSAKKVMLETRGVVDIAARLWIFEDALNVSKVTPFCDGVPMGSFLLEILSNGGDQAALDNVLPAAGGDIGVIAQTLVSRLKKTVKSPEFARNPVDGIFIFHFITRLCNVKPEMHESLLDHGAVPVCVKLLIQVACVMNEGSHNATDRANFIELIVLAFQFLWLSLEDTIGLPWVLEAISAGLITAFVECSPVYDDLEPDDYAIILVTIVDTIPKYLAYCSVAQAMDTALLRLEKTQRFLALRKTKAWKAFDNLVNVTAWRFAVVEQFKQMKKEVAVCFNPKCQKMDTRNTFRKCAKCHQALYCSKECQTAHWKDFGHKKECREPIKVHMHAGLQKFGLITPRDWEYIQNLNICEARRHMPHLKRLAAKDHPSTPLDDLTIVVDYNTVPTNYHVDLHSEWVKHHPHIFDIYKDGPEHQLDPEPTYKSSTYIVGIVPNGRGGPRLYATPFDGIWHVEEKSMREGSGVHLAGKLFVDWMKEKAEVRRKLYCST
ncbi:hypothetical protein BDN72DRAFT_965518 [Pluteus cervinus]|uniref:Uncharacterized protein n=1 Tax=Pluteus cervinus TaxID=181527 RepID=A0ACD3A654_9AGAR|nr:hypothetical protein BDN72DRAFT_965518 [Pluteus cervinus]